MDRRHHKIRLAARTRVGALLLFVFVTVFALWAYRGLRWDPRFTLEKLGGLTPDQVISAVGRPTEDERTLGWKPSDESARQYLHFFYDDRWGWEGQEYAVIFKGNRVVEVRRAIK